MTLDVTMFGTRGASTSLERGRSRGDGWPLVGVGLERIVGDNERALVVRAFGLSGGVRKRAAALLGSSFRSFCSRLVKLGVEKEDLGAEEWHSK